MGFYEYEHSWDHASPDGFGMMHCDETGTIDFKADGTYVDQAVQTHIHLMYNDSAKGDIADGTYKMRYYCEGDWKVEKGKFLFNEHSENFSLNLIDDYFVEERSNFAALISANSTPDSKRWFTFDIDRLDNEWFTWSYTDKHGKKTTWDMHRAVKVQ